MRARLLIAAAALVGSIVAAGPAEGETRSPGGGAFVDDSGRPTAVAVDAEVIGSAPGAGSAGETDCHWVVAVEDDFAFPIYGLDGRRLQHSQTGRWLERWCEGIGVVDINGFYIVPEGGLVDPSVLAQDALASIEIVAPEIRTNPSADDRLYVRVPTWLWVESAWWRSYEATASAGRVSSTVTARPTRTSWAFGDGRSLRCDGPGIAWRPGLAEDATDCRHTYTTSSAGRPEGTFDLSATVEFEISWTSNTGQGGTLPAISRTSVMVVEVGEIQAVGTA